jgi:hypothetical protein
MCVADDGNSHDEVSPSQFRFQTPNCFAIRELAVHCHNLTILLIALCASGKSETPTRQGHIVTQMTRNDIKRGSLFYSRSI